MAMPNSLASLDRAITQPSLLESTTTGFLRKAGLNTRSHDAKKLLQSTKANILEGITDGLGSTPELERLINENISAGTSVRIFPSKYWGTDLTTGEGFDEATQRAYEFITQNYIEGQQVAIYGYSWGGTIVNHLADRLAEDNIKVNLLVTIDAAGGPDNDRVRRLVSSNVEVNLNIYQTNPEWGSGSHGAPNIAILPDRTKVINSNYTNRYIGEPGTESYDEVRHSNINEFSHARVANAIINAIDLK